METELENGIAIYSIPTPKENGFTCNVVSNGGSNLKANGVLSQFQNNLWPVSQSPTVNPTLGHHLARRLVQIGVSDIFSVPGDSNLTLLDYFVDEPGLKLIGCCNELNAGYAADGYARSRGVGACVVTFTVGGLSLINAIAGAYSDDLPVICIVGGPNSNDYGSQKILHHTVGSPDFSQELKCFQTITCHQGVINELGEAQKEIDKAISMCLRHSKPVYISISCNLVSIPHHTFVDDPLPLFFPPKLSDGMALEMAVDAAAKLLNEAEKPVMVAGRKLRLGKAQKDFVALADACGYAVAVMPTAKGLLPENHPRFIGTYWGPLSTSYCSEVVEIADASLFAGAVFDELETVGYSFHFKKTKSVIVEPERVIIPNKPVFDNVLMKDFLKALAKRLERNPTAYENYDRIFIPDGVARRSSPQQALRVNVLFKHVQKLLLSSQMAVISETGDSWFQCQKLKLPEDCGYEMQLNYASIGWSVGATLGYAQATPHKRVLSCIGDGSFQMGPQEVSTMIRCGQRNIIFLINNGGYSIEVEIHDGPYNVIKNWDYTTLVNALHNGEGKCWTSRVRTEEELIVAIEKVKGDKKECLCFIEAIVDRDDTSKELLKLGSMMAALGARPPAQSTQ